MFLPIRDQGQGRRRRTYSHGSVYSGPRAARSSKFSLLSAITAQSSGSNGSNSTVTQESYNKSTKRRKSSRRKKETSRSRLPINMEPVKEAPPEDEPEEKSTQPEDVFTFLVDEASAADGVDARAGPLSPVDTEQVNELEPDPVPYPDDSNHGAYFSSGSFHSDSAISLDNGSFTIGKVMVQPLLPPTNVDHEASPRSRNMWRYPEIPKPQHVPFATQQHASIDDAAERGPDEHDVQPLQYTSPPSVFTESDPVFPLSTDHLASELADHDTPPLFKAFRKTNYRILLQLQDEIMELQEELSELDVYDGSRRLGKDPTTSESLRRLSFRWGQCNFDLYKAKTDVLARLQIRMDQYYKTLALSQKVHRLGLAQSCRTDDVFRFKRILENHFSIRTPSSDPSEQSSQQHFSFLDDDDDLVSLRQPQQTASMSHVPLISPIALVPLVLPLILFRVVSGVINRLLIVGLTLAICLSPLGAEKMRKWSGSIEGAQKNEQLGLVLCSCIATVVGLLV